MIFGSEATVDKKWIEDSYVKDFHVRNAKSKVISQFSQHFNTHFRDSIEEYVGISGNTNYKLSLAVFTREDLNDRLKRIRENIPSDVYEIVRRIMTEKKDKKCQ